VTGAAGAGTGTGSGAGGNGQGGGGGSAAVKIAGDINSARDYPIASRDLRIGDHVVIALTVGTDGRPSACRVVRASRDPEADAITCRLAMARFRFRPATDAAGQPVIATYGWQQRWFYRDAP
jgi:protein TonB